MTNFGAAIDEAIAPVPAPPIVMPLPGLPVLVFVPSAPLTGTMSDYAWWGWRPYLPGQHAVTGSDGSMGTPVIVGSDG
jgi:hypothetical protein